MGNHLDGIYINITTGEMQDWRCWFRNTETLGKQENLKNRYASKGKMIKKRKRSSNKIYKFYSREILIFLSYSLPLSNPLSSLYPGSCGTHSNGAYAYSEWPNTNLTTYLRAGFMMLWDDELAAKCCWAGFSASAHRRDGSKTIDWRHVRSVEIFPET